MQDIIKNVMRKIFIDVTEGMKNNESFIQLSVG